MIRNILELSIFQLTLCPFRCLKMGKLNPPPVVANPIVGYPASGLGASYEGLCDFACRAGNCPPTACGTVKVPLSTPTVSPFLPVSCVSAPQNHVRLTYTILTSLSICRMVDQVMQINQGMRVYVAILAECKFAFCRHLFYGFCGTAVGATYFGTTSLLLRSGFCPMHVCTCTSFGTLNIPAPTILKYEGETTDGSKDHGLCKFTCER